MLKKGDIILISIFIILALCGFALSSIKTASGRGNRVVIKVDGKEYARLSLSYPSQSKTLLVKTRDSHGKDSYNLVEIQNQRVRIKDADCPGKMCVKTGWISKPGQTIVCAPHKVVVMVESDFIQQRDEPDLVAY
ncbi:MAG TPA: NusG domain II-containing protein [Firmicutes bacterium]|nr:NusG domain II-containing protein [Bacillota bacterium]HHY98042.1 NusG domain II-containing protein [Bacillota bacterium]